MNSFYLLSYNKIPLGIYNKLSYLFDYILELIRFPDKNVNIYKIEINILEVNIAYPTSTLIFKLNKNLNKIFLEESNGKRVEMCSETFSRFKKIQNHFKKPIKKIELPKQEVKVEKKEPIKSKEEIYEINRLKYQMKTLEKWQNKFNSDLKLYNEFKEKKESQEDFEIPEMFKDTYEFFKNSKNVDDSFTEYFSTFNENSEVEFKEIEDLLDYDSSNSDSSNEDC